MRHHCKPLSFDKVQYSVDLVRAWLANPDADKFCFYGYYANDGGEDVSLELCCYVYSNALGNFLNPTDPDILVRCTNSTPVQPDGPVKLTANIISTGAVRDFLNAHPLATELIFTPQYDNVTDQVRYSIDAVDLSAAKAAKAEAVAALSSDGGIETNPSPPATVATDAVLV